MGKIAEKMQKFDTFILGSDNKCRVNTNSIETQLNNNFMVVGGSGAGKTTSIAYPMLLHARHSNFVGVFTKIGKLEKIMKYMKRKGYKVRMINFQQPEESEYGYDPLEYCRTKSDIQALAHAIVNAGEEGRISMHSDKYWEDSAISLLYVIMNHIKTGHFEEHGCRMSDVIDFISQLHWVRDDVGDTQPEDKYRSEKARLEDMEEKRKKYPAYVSMWSLEDYDKECYNYWQSVINLGDITGSCVMSSMKTPFQKIFQPELKALLNHKNMFHFEELLEPKTALFVYISPVNMAHHALAGLFYQQLFKELFELAEKRKSHILPHPVHVLCDDFATGCRVPDFAEYISIFREKLISVTLLIQSESQLASIYGQDKAQTIINNCDTYLYLGGMDRKTHESIAKRVNVPINEVADMPIGAEFFIRRGMKPFLTSRYNLYTDPYYINEIEDPMAGMSGKKKKRRSM